MGSTNSSSESKARSQQLAKVYNSVHYEVEIDEIFHAFKNCIKPLFPKQPEFQAHGGQTY
jgi:hypothetical protein